MATAKPPRTHAPARGALARIPAPLLAIAAIMFLQISSGTVKGVITQDNAMSLLFVRLSLGSAILWGLSKPPVRELSAGQWFDAGLLGFVVAGFNVSVYVALQVLPLGLMATFGFLGPLAVSFVGMRRRVDALWPLLGFCGVLMLTPWSGASAVSPAGVAAGPSRETLNSNASGRWCSMDSRTGLPRTS
jgi:inner membrane transporter RhtA